jgi:serine/threonine-protein kinase
VLPVLPAAAVALPVQLPASTAVVSAPSRPVDDDTPRILPAGASPPRALAGLAVTTADYPRAALASRMEGTVIVKVTVHIDGHVELVRFLKSDPNFNDAVLGILKRLRYAPVVFEGRRIAVYQNLKFPFTLN